MKILLFAGAGTSVELGVPAMLGMGEEFIAHSNQWDIEPVLVHKLMGNSLDIEFLIEALDRICTARSSLEVLNGVATQLGSIDKIRAEVEWFVQHAAERIVANEAKLMWGAVLRAAAATDLTLVTTNYDRAIELAANSEGVSLDDGFAPFGDGETASWVGFQKEGHRLRLVKLHGSTDWYSSGEFSTPTKLRHPMPLFGRATLRLTSGIELGSALILPSREKLLTHSPYPRLSQVFLNAADSCDLAVFVGSSLRDHHIRGAVESIVQRAPVILVSPSGDSFGITGAQVIKQCASSFLISTLPNALVDADPIASLTSTTSKQIDGGGILSAVRGALDTDLRSDLRCGAIEQLDEMGHTLDPVLIQQLLADRDATVARYALGLIPLSSKSLDLIKYANSSLHASEPAFSEDLLLLGEML